MRALSRLIVTVVFLLSGGGVVAQEKITPPPHWGSNYNSPNVDIRLVEIGRKTVSDSRSRGRPYTQVKYRLQIVRLQQDQKYFLCVKGWSMEAPWCPTGQDNVYRFDSAGHYVNIKGKKLSELVLLASLYPRGGSYEVALVSTDRSIFAFAQTYPFPIEAHDGSCRIWLDMGAADLFAVFGEGFPAGETVTTISRSNGEIIKETINLKPDKSSFWVMLAPAAKLEQHKASYTVKASSCEVKVDYMWGPPALQPQ